MSWKSRKVLGMVLVVSTLSWLLVLVGSVGLVSAYGAGETWQLGFAGTGTLSGMGFGFWGWCTFTGQTSGSVGDCQISQYLHMMGNSQNIQCQTHFDITSWSAQPGALTQLTSAPDFFVNSGTITVNPTSATQACASFLSAAGFKVSVAAPGTLTINGPSDMALPAAPGHYSLSGLTLGVVSYTELQIQVSQK
jgi:hypothetical protein